MDNDRRLASVIVLLSLLPDTREGLEIDRSLARVQPITGPTSSSTTTFMLKHLMINNDKDDLFARLLSGLHVSIRLYLAVSASLERQASRNCARFHRISNLPATLTSKRLLNRFSTLVPLSALIVVLMSHWFCRRSNRIDGITPLV